MPAETTPSHDGARPGAWRRGRRRVLHWLSLAAGASGVVGALPAGCGGPAGSAAPPAGGRGASGRLEAPVEPGAIPPAPPVRVPLDLLAPGARHPVKYGEIPVEVRREGDRIAARVLLCTHMGCLVRWEAAPGHYRCVCHDGRFNADGDPIQGFPTAPLARLSVRQVGGEVIVGESTTPGEAT